MSNTRLWDKLGKTDPANTKSFKRAGGFSGTAIKPMWSFKRMTEEFGPCGEGWGMYEPTFQTVPGNNGEVLVYCTVQVWWKEENSGVRGMFGVGGDKVVTYIKANEQYNRPERWENDDEAFKKAYTDAIGNALKLIGVGADVHMGLFDDSKYVNEMRQEFAEEPAQKPQRKPVAAESNNPAPEQPKGFTRHLNAVTAAKDMDSLKAAWDGIDADQGLSQEDYDQLKVGVNQKKKELAYVAPDFSKLPPETQQAVKNLGA